MEPEAATRKSSHLWRRNSIWYSSPSFNKKTQFSIVIGLSAREYTININSWNSTLFLPGRAISVFVFSAKFDENILSNTGDNHRLRSTDEHKTFVPRLQMSHRLMPTAWRNQLRGKCFLLSSHHEVDPWIEPKDLFRWLFPVPLKTKVSRWFYVMLKQAFVDVLVRLSNLHPFTALVHMLAISLARVSKAPILSNLLFSLKQVVNHLPLYEISTISLFPL